jgi:hypothetical protein
MLQPHRLLLLSGFSVLLLAGCGSASVGTQSGTIAAPSETPITTPPMAPPNAAGSADAVKGTDDTVAVVASVSGAVSVAVGASQTISVIFTSSDGKLMTGFAVSGSLNTLPSGWSGPSSFACATVAPGNGCALTLTYAPTTMGSGTLTLDCVYVDNAETPRTPGPCLTLSYAATLANNVLAAVSSAGEVDAVVGVSKQAVSVNFVTDDGNPATALTLTSNLSSLPAGWSSSATALSCAIVRTGNGCQLPLMFAPSAAVVGTLTLNYSYVDDSGATRTAAVNIPYASVATGTVVAAVAPSGQVNAIENTGSATVAVTFTSDDGKAASDLVLISDLAALPAGWSSGSGFTCGSVSTGNGCQLQLKYAPAGLTSGTFTLRYAYENEAGAANTGLVNVSYAATTNNNVMGTPAPTGEIDAMVGASGSVAVTFTTDDGRPATALSVTGGLTTLPAGWSSNPAALSCSGVTSGSSCQLLLTYAPTAADSGTLMLSFGYSNNAGEAKSGTVSIPYRATTNDNVTGSVLPSPVAVLTGSSNPVVLTFVTDDGNLATALRADLSMLPAGWSSASSSFSCAAISVGTACQLTLTYAPTAAANASLALGFGYTNNSGIAKTGTVTVAYTAAP